MFVSFALAFNALNNATLIIRRVAFAAERASAPGDAFLSREALRWLDRDIEGAPRGGVVPTDTLRAVFEFAASEELTFEPKARDARVSELLHIYAQRGRAGFHETRLEDTLFPSTGLWFSEGDPLAMLAPLALVGLLLACSVVCFSIVGSDRDLARSDARLEWWFSFPVPTRALLLARILGAALVNPLAWLLLAPFFYALFWCAGCGPRVGLLLALAAVFYLTVLGGCLRVVAETGLRRALSVRRVAQVQAVLELFSYAPLLGVFAATSQAGLDFTIEQSVGFSRGALLNPLSLPFAWLLPHGWQAGLGAALVLAIAIYGSIAFGSAMLRDGLVSASEPVFGTRAPVAVATGASRPIVHVLAARELLSIVRDPARITRVFLFPLGLLVCVAFTDPSLLHAILSEPQHASAAAFCVGTFVLLGGGLPTLANEGPGLWILYTTPRSLEAVLARRALFWTAVASIGVLVTLLVIAMVTQNVRFVLNEYAMLAFAGTCIFGVVAVALGALGTDVMESARPSRLQSFTPQLFLLMTGMFAFALYAPSLWAKFAQLSLSALFAFALWQKLRDHTLYFLDPTEAPPPALAVSDGIFAVLAFFVLQGLLWLLFARLGLSSDLVQVVAFTGAGLIVSAAALWVFRHLGVPDLARTLGLASLGVPRRTIALGVVAGVSTGGMALFYTQLVLRVDWLRTLYTEGAHSLPSARELRWFVMLAVGAAPLFEELLFRGILYRGFRR
ncbi:MAG TPA: hypothetical protein VI299_03835 [Polyangiales bacterium]